MKCQLSNDFYGVLVCSKSISFAVSFLKYLHHRKKHLILEYHCICCSIIFHFSPYAFEYLSALQNF